MKKKLQTCNENQMEYWKRRLFVTGSALVKSGQTQQKLGQAERDYMQSTANNFLQPLGAFLEGDMKTVQVWSASS